MNNPTQTHHIIDPGIYDAIIRDVLFLHARDNQPVVRFIFDVLTDEGIVCQAVKEYALNSSNNLRNDVFCVVGREVFEGGGWDWDLSLAKLQTMIGAEIEIGIGEGDHVQQIGQRDMLREHRAQLAA